MNFVEIGTMLFGIFTAVMLIVLGGLMTYAGIDIVRKDWHELRNHRTMLVSECVLWCIGGLLCFICSYYTFVVYIFQ